MNLGCSVRSGDVVNIESDSQSTFESSAKMNTICAYRVINVVSVGVGGILPAWAMWRSGKGRNNEYEGNPKSNDGCFCVGELEEKGGEVYIKKKVDY